MRIVIKRAFSALFMKTKHHDFEIGVICQTISRDLITHHKYWKY